MARGKVRKSWSLREIRQAELIDRERRSNAPRAGYRLLIHCITATLLLTSLAGVVVASERLQLVDEPSGSYLECLGSHSIAVSNAGTFEVTAGTPVMPEAFSQATQRTMLHARALASAAQFLSGVGVTSYPGDIGVDDAGPWAWLPHELPATERDLFDLVRDRLDTVAGLEWDSCVVVELFSGQRGFQHAPTAATPSSQPREQTGDQLMPGSMQSSAFAFDLVCRTGASIGKVALSGESIVIDVGAAGLLSTTSLDYELTAIRDGGSPSEIRFESGNASYLDRRGDSRFGVSGSASLNVLDVQEWESTVEFFEDTVQCNFTRVTVLPE